MEKCKGGFSETVDEAVCALSSFAWLPRRESALPQVVVPGYICACMYV